MNKSDADLAKIGIIALVDEATGFQRKREPDALHKMMQEYTEKPNALPYEYFQELDRLHGGQLTAVMKNGGTDIPEVSMKFARRYIYAPIMSEKLREELLHGHYDAIDKFRKTRGSIDKIHKQMNAVILLMRVSESLDQFDKLYNRWQETFKA